MIRACFVPEIEPDKQCIDDQTALSANETNEQGHTSWFPESISNISQRRSIYELLVVGHGMRSTFLDKAINLRFLYLLQVVQSVRNSSREPAWSVPYDLAIVVMNIHTPHPVDHLTSKICTCTSYKS
jgi:hypothetical protein